MVAKITAKQKRFVREYIKDCNATRAAKAAGYSEDTAYQTGYELLKKPEIKNLIDEEEERRAQRTLIEADEILLDLYNRATADPNELVELRRGCCRFCWGVDFKYQRTEGEMRRAQADYAFAVESAEKGEEPAAPFDPQGGTGYDARRKPNADCPECFGEGEMRVFFKDTRSLSPQARALFGGVKVTREGIEVKMRSQDNAIELLGKHLKLFTEKLEVEAGISFADIFAAARARAKKVKSAESSADSGQLDFLD